MRTITPQHHCRRAVAMIELIFAIVIMGLVLLSAPMMITGAVKSSNVAFEQESIAIAAAHTASLMSYAWDEGNTDGLSPNILCTSSTAAFECNATVIPGARRRANSALFGTQASLFSTFGHPDMDLGPGTVEVVQDDIDDFDGNITQLTIANASPAVINEGDYMDQTITIATQISYDNDAPAAGACTASGNCIYSNPTASGGPTTNVKGIQTQLTSAHGKNIVLRAFMCNIGALDVDSRGNI